MTRAGMVGMAMCDDGPVHRTHRVDVEITNRAIQPRWRWMEKLVRRDHSLNLDWSCEGGKRKQD